MRVLFVDHSQRHARSEVRGMLNAWRRVAEVRFFDYRAVDAARGRDAMNAALCREAEEFRPDIVQIGKGESIRDATVKYIKEVTGAIVLLWFGDLRLRVPAHIAAKGKYADWTLLFHKDPQLMEAYRKAGCQRIGYCGWGFDQNVYYPRGGERDLDAVFMGHLYPREREERLAMVGALSGAGLGVHTYGPLKHAGNFGPSWIDYQQDLGILCHPFADLDEAAVAYSHFKIAPGLSNDRAYFHFGLRRAYESMACGCLHLVRYAPGMEEMFDDRRHLVWWKTLDELAELARYYLAHGAEREAIAQQGASYVLKHYTWDHAIQRYLAYVEEARR